jgi:imidazolonepropionase
MLALKNIAQVVTLGAGAVPRRGPEMAELGIIRNGAIIIRGERVTWVGSTHDFPVRQPGAETRILDCMGLELVALPGFVDSHTHPIFGGTRVEEYEMRALGKSYQEIAAAGGGIRESVRQLRRADLGSLTARAERHLRQFLEHGTTTIEAKSGYGLSTEDELKALRAIAALRAESRLEIVATFLGAHAIPEEHEDSRQAYIEELIREMIPRVAQEGLADFCDVFCDAGYFTVDEARVIFRAAKTAGLGLRIHAEELAHSGGARLAAELGARSADHLEWVDEEDISALRQSGTVATLLPGTAFNLGLTKYPPARRLIEAGVPVALATDFNPGSCFTPNMQIILSIACSQMRMTPAEVITASTINGAYSLGLSERLGSIEDGKQADIVLMDVADYREIPYYFGVNHCVAVIKKGQIVINRLERP